MGTEMNTLHILNIDFSIEIKTQMQQTKHSVTGVFCSNLDPHLKCFFGYGWICSAIVSIYNQLKIKDSNDTYCMYYPMFRNAMFEFKPVSLDH